MALETLVTLFGADATEGLVGPHWVMGNVFGYGRGLSDDYLRRDWSAGGALRRIISLAEMLYHFQEVEGIERLTQSIQVDTLETTIAELEGAKLLYLSGLPFRFVTPSGCKGSDFDVQVSTPAGSSINCEMKCKLETTTLADQTIVDTLKKSADQLPKDEANVIFMKVPEIWVQQPQIEATVRQAVRRFFGRSRRVAAVVFHWQETIPIHNGLAIHLTKYRHEPNRRSQVREFVITELIHQLYRQPQFAQPSNIVSNSPSRWRYFDQIVQEMTA